jgi:hypothetical protein
MPLKPSWVTLTPDQQRELGFCVKPGAWRIVPRAGGEVRTNFVCVVEGSGADIAGYKVVELNAQ